MSALDYVIQKQASQLTAFGETQVAQLTPKLYAQFPYNINSELFTDNSTASGTLSVANSFCQISSGAASSSTGKITSIPVIEYHPGTGGLVRFTAVFDTAVEGNNQIIGAGDDNNGFFVGYNGTDFGIWRRKDGADFFTAQDAFTDDKLDGTGSSGMTLDTSKGNVFQIQYQWLGFGEIRFYVENPVSGKLFIFHRIVYANANTGVSISNPTLPFQAESTNTTNNTDIVLKVPSVGIYSEGIDGNAMHLVHGKSNTKTGVTTENNIITIRNNATYATKTNLLRVQPKLVSAASDGNKPAVITCYKNASLGGSPSYTNFNANTSPVSFDVAGTTVSNGIEILTFTLAKSGNDIVYLDQLPIILAPGDTFTVTGQSSQAADISVSITWEERFS